MGLILLFIFTSCKVNTQNSNSLDAISESKCSSLTGEALKFCNSQNIIKSRCVSCHTGYHNVYADYDQQDYINQALIRPSDAADSTLIKRLFNAGGNMPQGGSALPSEEYETLKDWVNSIP